MQRIFESHVTCSLLTEYLQARLNCRKMTNPLCIHYKPFIINCVIGNSHWTAMTKTIHWLGQTSIKQDTAWVWVMYSWYCNFENKLKVRITPASVRHCLVGIFEERHNSQWHILIWPVLSDRLPMTTVSAVTSIQEASTFKHPSFTLFILYGTVFYKHPVFNTMSLLKCSVPPF